MIILPKSDISPSEITPEHIFKDRRTFIKQAGFGFAAASIINQKAFGGTISSGTTEGDGRLLGRANQKAVISQQKDPVAIKNYKKTAYGQGEKLTKENDVIGYNNFYEFGTGKEDPAEFSDSLQTDPWSVSIEGAVKQNKTITMEDILKRFPLEERIYRMRCVEGWSMVIPWVGLSLADFIKWAQPTGNAKYVEFVSFADRQQMPGTNLPILDWPYTEALRLDEAMNDLTILAVGLYGKTLPNQNGAPIRLVVPWKYGFKGGKSIVKIRFTEKMPRTTWMKAGPREYGFYANVNPNVDHPRWSQSSEKPIGGGLFGGRIKTKMFNGYTDQVGQLYAGLDLAKNF